MICSRSTWLKHFHFSALVLSIRPGLKRVGQSSPPHTRAVATWCALLAARRATIQERARACRLKRRRIKLSEASGIRRGRQRRNSFQEFQQRLESPALYKTWKADQTGHRSPGCQASVMLHHYRWVGQWSQCRRRRTKSWTKSWL